MYGAGRAGHIVDLIDFDAQRIGNIMANDLEILMLQQMGNVPAIPCEKIVEADNLMAFAEQRLADVGADKTRSTGDQRDDKRHFVKSPSGRTADCV
jgi:hypothetical protein